MKMKLKLKMFAGDMRATPPKLSYSYLPAVRRSTELLPGTATPPLRTPGRVPFLWEEAPGKPLNSYEVNMDLTGDETRSPTTVLDGPYMLRRPPRDFCHLFSAGDEKVLVNVRRAKGEGKKTMSVKSWWKGRRSTAAVLSRAASFSSSLRWEEEEEEDRVRIMRSRRNKRFLGVSSNTASRLWAGIKVSLKQMVQWRND